AAACDGLEIRTIEGFDDDPLMEELREAFSREHALQCGFCTPGMLIAARDIVQRLPGADERRVRLELAGNLCRCTGYLGIVRPVCPGGGRGGGALAARRPGAPAATEAAPVPSPPPRFVPAESVPAAPRTAPALESGPRAGATRFEESFVLHRPPPVVWEALA